MESIIFDGKAHALIKREECKRRVLALKEKGVFPKMVTILGDESSENELYASMKGKFAKEVGIEFLVHRFKITDKAEKIIKDIKEVNFDFSVHGLMVQLPIPEPFVLESIDPKKDVDCLTSENLGLLMKGRPRFLPATVKAVLEIIHNSKFKMQNYSSKFKIFGNEKWLAGETVCIVGASGIVGKPLAMVLSDAGATITVCRSTTKNLHDFTKNADILISATGAPELINEEMVKEKAVVIDVGISRLLRDGRYRVVGDVHSKVAKKTSFLTPVPGGVGPVTVACLFENLLDAVGM